MWCPVKPWLNMHHTIFGKVISGYDVVQKIENTATGPVDRPITEQKIIKAYHSPELKKFVETEFKGSVVASW